MGKNKIKIIIISLIVLIILVIVFVLLNTKKDNGYNNLKTMTKEIIAGINLGYNDLSNQNEKAVTTEYSYVDSKLIKTQGNINIIYTAKNPEVGSILINADGTIKLILYSDGYCAVKQADSDNISITKKSKDDCLKTDSIVIKDIKKSSVFILGNETYLYILKSDGTVSLYKESLTDYTFETIASGKVETTDLTDVKDITYYINGLVVLYNDGTIKRHTIYYDTTNSKYEFNIEDIAKIENIKEIYGTYYNVYFLLNDGTVMAMGDNSSGQLGDGTTNEQNIPIIVNGLSNVNSIASGADYAMFLLNNGTVMGVGGNDYGQLGNGTKISTNSVITIPNLTNVKQIATGSYHTMFLLNDGTVMATGLDSYGQLGDNDDVDKETPVKLNSLTNVKEIKTLTTSTLFIMNDNTIKGTGDNSSFQINNSEESMIKTPILIQDVNDVRSIYSYDISYTNTRIVYILNDGTIKLLAK